MADLNEFIDQLQISCVAVALTASESENVRELVIDFLHTFLAERQLDDDRRAIIDRMAEKISAEGLDLKHGAYRGLR